MLLASRIGKEDSRCGVQTSNLARTYQMDVNRYLIAVLRILRPIVFERSDEGLSLGPSFCQV